MNKLFRVAQLICETDMSNRRIGGIVGTGYNTVKKYRRLIIEKGLTWNDIAAMSTDALERLLRTATRRVTKRRLPDWNHVYTELQRRDVTRALLWEEYRLAHPDSALSISRFNELLNEYTGKLNVSMRFPHRAGQCAYVDFAGSTIPWTDAATGKEHQAQVFVGVLGCSNYTFAHAVASQSIPDWIDVLNRMFRFFGGAPQVVVSDNLKAAVVRPGREPEFQRFYYELLLHYGAYPLTARVYRPKDKAKAEVAVQFVERWVIACLRNVKFFSLEEINAAIAALLPRINEKKFRHLPGNRRSRFEELERAVLKELPAEPYEYAEWTGPQKVPLDYHVYVHKHYYSVPYSLVHEKVEAKVTARIVEILHKNKRIAIHQRSNEIGGHTTDPRHRAPDHQQFAELSPERFLDWAATIGTAATAVVQYQFDNHPHPLPGIRACSTLQNLAKEYGAERFESACARAKAIGSFTVKSIRSILQRRLTELEESETPLQVSLPLHHNVRGPAYYAQGGR